MNPKRTLATLALLFLAGPAWAASHLDRDREVLVRLKTPGGAHALGDLARDHESDLLGADGSGWAHLRDRGDGQLAKRLRADARVASVEPNYTVRATATVDSVHGSWTPGDPWFPRQWNLASMPAAWYTTRGEATVVVAVLDTGLRTTSADAPLFTLPGRDFVNGDLDPDDDNGHGTHIASIIAQATDNAFSAAAMAPGVSLLPVKVLDATGHGTLADLATALYWATDAGAKVINLSVALPPCIVWSDVLHDAIAYAAGRGVVLVGAVGNDGEARVSLPAAFNEVIAVGGLHSGGARAAYSNTGDAVDLLAPGGDAEDRDLDTRPDAITALAFDPETGVDGLYYGAGSSQAAAHVSGAAALLMSLGETDRDRIRSLLELTARSLGAARWSPDTGYGALDLPAAIAARASLQTIAEKQLQGFVSGQSQGAEHGNGLASPVIVFAAHDHELLVIMEDGLGVWGLVDQGGAVALYRLHGSSLGKVLGGHAERFLRELERAGSVLEWIHGAGRYHGSFAAAGGVTGLVGGAGGVGGLVEGAGLLFVMDRMSATGTVGGLVEGAGGVIGLVGSQSALLALIESSNGLLGLIESAGGTIGLVDGAGGIIGLVGGAIEVSTFGTPNGLLAAE